MMSMLDARSLAMLGATCRRMRALSGDNRLWLRLYSIDFGPVDQGGAAGRDMRLHYARAAMPPP